MNYVETTLAEFEVEMATTRRVLERVPDEKFDWKAHPKSNSIGWNANHVAEIPGWVEDTFLKTSWDFAPPDGQPGYILPEYKSREEVLAFFDKNVARGREVLRSIDESTLNDDWSLLQGGQVIFTMPRWQVMRIFVLNHLIHHRAFLCSYFRLNDIPVPAVYGPSADEQGP